MTARKTFESILLQAIDYLDRKYGAAKTGRDPNEPGKGSKDNSERDLSSGVTDYLATQQRALQLSLENLPRNNASQAIDPALASATEQTGSIIAAFTSAAQAGIGLFAFDAAFDIDTTLVNMAAANWARDYSMEMIRGINDTTRQAVQDAVADFVTTPGMTVGDVMSRLEPVFGEVRARMIATTEITRAYARANQLAGEALAKQYPDILVVKKWFTNNDDRVCPICQPLNGMEIGIDEQFPNALGGLPIDTPPAHVNCRCWMSTRTRIQRRKK